MKNSLKIWCLLSLLVGFHVDMHAGCAAPDTGVRVWDIVSDDFVISCETFSVVSGIDSKIDDLDLGELLSKVDIVDSKADVIIDLDESILSKVDAAESCCSQVDLILSTVDIIDSKIDDLNVESELDVIISKVSIIDSKLDTLDACGATAVMGNGFTISSSGVYCLSEDITGDVVIASSDVTFDLNGHTITGTIALSAALQNIVIRNGTVVVPASPSGQTGVSIEGVDANNQVENVALEDLAIYCNGNCGGSTGGAHGIYINFATDVTVSGLSSNSAVIANLLVDNVETLLVEASDFSLSCSAGISVGANGTANNFVIRSCNFYENAVAGIECHTATNGVVTDCLCVGNSAGITLFDSSRAIAFNDCSLFSNTGLGVYVQGAQQINFVACQAINNAGAGFLIEDAARDIDLISCVSNTSAVESGFRIQGTAQRITLISCQAQSNNLFGFIVTETASQITFDDCLADANENRNFYVFGDNGISRINFIGCQASNSATGTGFYVGNLFSSLSGPQYITFTSCQAYNNATVGFELADLTGQITLTECQAVGNVGIGFLVGSSASVGLLDNCTAVSNGSNGFYIGGNNSELLTFKECVATDNGSYGFIDNSAPSTFNRYVACYANRNTPGNYNPAVGAPFNPVDATSSPISYWNNTFSS